MPEAGFDHASDETLFVARAVEEIGPAFDRALRVLSARDWERNRARDVRPCLASGVEANIAVMLPVLAQMMDRGDPRDGGGGHWWGWLIGLAVLAMIVGLVVWAVIRLTQSHATAGASPPAAPRSSAEDLLADRLARGEIGPDEYRERLSALRE